LCPLSKAASLRLLAIAKCPPVPPPVRFSSPFLSYGGSSMLAASIGIGMVLMISKKMRKE